MKKLKNMSLLALFSVATTAPVDAVTSSDGYQIDYSNRHAANEKLRKRINSRNLSKCRDGNNKHEVTQKLFNFIKNGRDDLLRKTVINNIGLFQEIDWSDFLKLSITQDNYGAVKILQPLIVSEANFDQQVFEVACSNGFMNIVDGILKSPDFDQKRYAEVAKKCLELLRNLEYSEIIKKINEHFDGFHLEKISSSIWCDDKKNSTETLKHFIDVEMNKNTIDKNINIMINVNRILEHFKCNNFAKNFEIKEINDYFFRNSSFLKEDELKNMDIEYFKNLIDTVIYFCYKSIKEDFCGNENLVVRVRSLHHRVLKHYFKAIINSENDKHIPLAKYILQKFIDGEIELPNDLINWDDRKKENLLTKIYTSDQEGKNFHVKVLEKIEELEQVHSKQVSEVATDENKKNKKKRKKTRKINKRM